MKILILCIPQTLGSAPLLHMLNNTWSVRLCSFADMIGMKLYLFVILLLGILLVAIKLGTLYNVYWASLFPLFMKCLNKLFAHFTTGFLKLKKKKKYLIYIDIYVLYI